MLLRERAGEREKGEDLKQKVHQKEQLLFMFRQAPRKCVCVCVCLCEKRERKIVCVYTHTYIYIIYIYIRRASRASESKRRKVAGKGTEN